VISYSLNTHGQYGTYSLIDKAWADSMYASSNTYLPLTGGTMTGDIMMQLNNIYFGTGIGSTHLNQGIFLSSPRDFNISNNFGQIAIDGRLGRILMGNAINISNYDTTANLDITPSSSTLASLNIKNSSTVLTSPQTEDIWVYNHNLLFNNGTQTYTLNTVSGGGGTSTVTPNQISFGAKNTGTLTSSNAYVVYPTHNFGLTNDTAYFSVGSPFTAGGTYATDFDPSINENGHSSVVADIFQRTTAGYAHNSFTDNAQFIGTSNYDHHAAFQSQFNFNNTSTTSLYYGFVDIPKIASGSSLGIRYGSYIFDITGSGTVTTQYAHYVPALTNAANNWAFYSVSTPNFFGGTTQSSGNLYVGSNVASPGSLFLCGQGSYGATVTANFSHGLPLGSFSLSNITETWVSASGSKLDFNVTNGSGTSYNTKIFTLDGTTTSATVNGNLLLNTQYTTPVTTNTVTTNSAVQTLICNPAGTLAALTIVFPPSPVNNQTFSISISKIITTLTLQAGTGGATINGTIITTAANSAGKFIYQTTPNDWFYTQ
jgi:hypothetical protein